MNTKFTTRNITHSKLARSTLVHSASMQAT